MIEALKIQRVGSEIRALNDPDEIAVASDILSHVDHPELVSWHDGTLTFHLADGPRDYRWTHDTVGIAHFARVRD